jgi:hypothetical protein
VVRRSDGLCIEVANSATGNGGTLQLAKCTSGTNQQWSVKAAPQAGVFKLVGKQSNRCMDRDNSKTWTGTPTWLWDCVSSTIFPFSRFSQV